jgi:hypothetical protein
MHDHPDCLAKKEGWVSRDWETWVMNPSGLLVFKHDIPDYFNDLNAMHEAEKVLTKANWGGYAAELYRITDAHNHGISPNHHWLAVAFSTASQRAEAFLRTIGKWKE